MKLSIIIPVYQAALTLDRCVRSVIRQSYTDYELILVEDGSPDDCAERCDKWAEQDQRIRVIHQANRGLSAARNKGIEAAMGEWITFIDSDDYISQNTLQPLMTFLSRQTDVDLLEYPVSGILALEPCTYDTADDYWTASKAYTHTYACNKIFRRRLFDEVRFPEGRVFEDAYTLPLLLKRVRQVATARRGSYHYCTNPNGITATAKGSDLAQLLDAHLHNGMPMNDDYYLHLLNIQMDVTELTGQAPTLPYRKVKDWWHFSDIFLLKALANNLLGINRMCNINQQIHKIWRSR